MKTSLVLGLSLTLLTLTGAANATKKTYSAVMTGDGEVPKVDTAGTGFAILTVDDVNKTICGKVTYTALSGAPNAMHIHEGDETVASGGVVQGLDVGASPIKVNVTNVDATKLTKIFTGPTYLNIHTEDHGGGEIRGQLAEGGDVQLCDGEKADAGSPGTPSDGDPDDSDGKGGGASKTDGGNGAGTVRADAGSTPEGSGGGDDGGCATSGTTPGGSLALALGVGFALTTLARVRRRR